MGGISDERQAMHILVTAASKHGATAEIGEAIAANLERGGHTVETRPAGQVQSLEQYDAVVLGAAIYGGRWVKDAHLFVDRFEPELTAKPLWVFSSGPTGAPPKPDPEDVVELTDIVERLLPRETVVFAGKLDSGVLSFAERAIIKAVHAEEGDFRDWEAVRAWARHIASDLARKPRQGAPTA